MTIRSDLVTNVLPNQATTNVENGQAIDTNAAISIDSVLLSVVVMLFLQV